LARSWLLILFLGLMGWNPARLMADPPPSAYFMIRNEDPDQCTATVFEQFHYQDENGHKWTNLRNEFDVVVPGKGGQTIFLPSWSENPRYVDRDDFCLIYGIRILGPNVENWAVMSEGRKQPDFVYGLRTEHYHTGLYEPCMIVVKDKKVTIAPLPSSMVKPEKR
jgi:hypothetical protein